jgi:hypothetical protein
MRKQSSRNAFTSIALGTLVGIASLMLTSFDALWSSLGVVPDLRPVQAGAVAILAVNLGFLLAFYFQQKDFTENLVDQQNELVDALLRIIPSSALFSYYTGDDALKALARLLPDCKYALNTRIFCEELNPTHNPGFPAWETAVRSAVRRGLSFRDVLSRGNEGLVLERCRVTKGGRGIYEAALIDYEFPSFLNFIVLELVGGGKEVWFGWLISRGLGFEGPVIRTTERRIVALFESWHRDLFSGGEPVAGLRRRPSAGAGHVQQD